LQTIESEGELLGALVVRVRLDDPLQARRSFEFGRNVEGRMLRNLCCAVYF